jgi:hypothetical protein
LAALLVLMVQLAAGAYVPGARPGTEILGTICHGADDAPVAPAPHGNDCLVCPLCAAVHAPPVTILPLAPVLPPRRLPLPVRNPPSALSAEPRAEPRPACQPRAPPAFA